MTPQEKEALDVQRKSEFDSWLLEQPKSIPCQIHPFIQRTANMDVIMKERGLARGFLHMEYAHCRTCVSEKQLSRQDVPENLFHATLENWQGDSLILGKVQEFAKARRGFLVLLGNYGVGKSHLAVGVMRRFDSAWLVKQSSLLLMLRDTYSDKKAKDPVPKAQSVGLLVLDEIGISGGGRDEAPMLHEILSNRYEKLQPTILTSNLAFDQLKLAIGERMADRLKECAFAVLSIGGESHRPQKKADYFTQAKPKEQDNFNMADSLY